jgi:cytochrome P450
MRKNTGKMARVSRLKTLLNFKSLTDNPMYFFQKVLKENNGLVEFKIPYNFVLTDRPEIIRQFLQKNNKNYIKTKIVRGDLRQVIGNGLLTSNGAYWLRQRRLIQKGFHKRRLELISNTMTLEIERYMSEVMDSLAADNLEFDLTTEMADLAFRVVAKSLFGEAVSEQQLQLIGRVIAETQAFIVNRLRKPFLKPWYYISGANYRINQLVEQGNAMLLKIIRTRKASKKKQDDLLQMLVDSRFEDGTEMNEQQILAEALILLVAGHETTAMSLSWTFMLLAQHPAIEDKLRLSVVDTLADQIPTLDDTRTLTYTQQVIEESMRLYPPAWIVDREPLEDDSIEGITLKKGIDVAAFIYGLHRKEDYWENPEQFDPNRFDEANKKKQIPYAYLPFGGGPRKCIGYHFAMMEMQYILAMFVRKYRFELVRETQIKVQPLVTLRAKNGIWVRVITR